MSPAQAQPRRIPTTRASSRQTPCIRRQQSHSHILHCPERGTTLPLPTLSLVDGDCAGSDAHALSWHVAPTVVPRDTVSTPSLSVPISTAFTKACTSLCNATHLTSQVVAIPYAWVALLVAFATVPSRTDSAFVQLSCWRTVLRLDFINRVLAQLHDLHCFPEPLFSREQPFLRARRLARGHRATFTAVRNSAALDSPHQHDSLHGSSPGAPSSVFL
eukprot:4096619-Pleurochrysis_carterae.AAC.3